jgi:hypothetical protein
MDVINFLIKSFAIFWLFWFIVGFFSTYFITKIWPEIEKYFMKQLVEILVFIFDKKTN